MYYPPSQIQTNLYTGGGEYVIASSGENYIGNYYSLFNCTFFTGKNPSNTNFSIIKHLFYMEDVFHI